MLEKQQNVIYDLLNRRANLKRLNLNFSKVFGYLVSCLITSMVLPGCSTLGDSRRELVLEKKWSRSLPNDDELGAERYHGMAPLIADGVIYQGNGKDSFVAIRRSSGREIWRYPIRNGVSSGAVAYDDDILFGASDGQFYSVDARTGSLNWTLPVRQEVLAPPLLDSETVYFLAANNVIYAIDAKTGKQKWLYNRADTTTFSIRGGAQPTIYNGKVFVGFSDGFFVSLDARNGNLIWERNLNKNPKFKDVNGTAVRDGESFYVSSYDDSLYKLSVADGQIEWRVEKGGHAPVTVLTDRLVYPTSEGELLAVDKKTGNIIWTYKVHEGIATAVQPLDEFIIVGETKGRLLVLSPSDGKIVTSFDPGWGISASPSVDPDTKEIFIATNAGNIFALQLKRELRGTKLPWESKQ